MLQEQWIGNSKAAGSNSVGRQLFRVAFLSSRRSGGPSLGFYSGSLWARKHENRLNRKLALAVMSNPSPLV